MHSTSIWLHNVLDSQPAINIETHASPLIGNDDAIHTECRLIIERTPGYGSLTLLMTNAQARQIIDTLQTHLNTNDKLTINWAAFDNQNANPS
jgi:hypothetical protein